MDSPRGYERTAGAVLVRGRPSEPRLLLIRRRARVHELPKGHVELGESEEQAALRELCEETGLIEAPAEAVELGVLRHDFPGVVPRRKRIRVFLLAVGELRLRFGPLPPGTRALRWLGREELPQVPLRSESLRPLLAMAFERYVELEGHRRRREGRRPEPMEQQSVSPSSSMSSGSQSSQLKAT